MMLEINVNEQLALGRLAEELSLGRIKIEDIKWWAKVFKIFEYTERNTRNLRLQLLLFDFNERVDKEIMFDFLNLTFTKYYESFPKLMEEILKKYFLPFAEDLDYYEKDKEYLERLYETRRQEPEYLSRYKAIRRSIEVLGYELNIIASTSTSIEINIVKKDMDEARHLERNKLFTVLEKSFEHEYIALKGAYERYLQGGVNANRQAIDSCRNAYENFFKKITGRERWKESLNDKIKSETVIALIKNVYSYLSGHGTHSPVEREREDAFLAIRITEDVMIRVLTEIGTW